MGGLALSVVAVLMLILSPEGVSGAFAIAMVTVGPAAAVMGWLLHRRWSAVAAALALLAVAGNAQAHEAVTDPAKSSYVQLSADTLRRSK